MALGLLATWLGALALAAAAEEPSGTPSPTPVSIEAVLASPEAYQGRRVLIRAIVVETKRAVAPNGRTYFTTSVGTGEARLTVFSWTQPSVDEGDEIEVVGVYYPWRYNIRHMIMSQRIIRRGNSTR